MAGSQQSAGFAATRQMRLSVCSPVISELVLLLTSPHKEPAEPAGRRGEGQQPDQGGGGGGGGGPPDIAERSGKPRSFISFHAAFFSLFAWASFPFCCKMVSGR